MDDIRKTPYAGFTEHIARSVMQLRPEKIAVVALMKDGSAFTSTYGNCGPFDVGTMAFHLQADAMREIIEINLMIDDEEEE